jgi:putative FmdB family regulatory protein
MPLYDYSCKKCGSTVEVRHGFDQTHDAPCQACGGPMQRVFNPAPIVFKGSGFYVTDSRKSSGSAASESKPAESKPAETKPAEASKPAESASSASSSPKSSGESAA